MSYNRKIKYTLKINSQNISVPPPCDFKENSTASTVQAIYDEQAIELSPDEKEILKILKTCK